MGGALQAAYQWMVHTGLLLFFAAGTNAGALAFDGELKTGIPQHLPGLTLVTGELVYNNQMAWYAHIHQCVRGRLGLPTPYQIYPTPRLIAMAVKGELDVIFPLGFSRIRDRQLTRSASFTTVADHFVFIDPPGAFTDTTLIVAARLGTPQASYLKRQGYTNLVLLEDYARFGELLERGRIDMAAVPHIALDTIKQSLASPSSRLRSHIYTTRGVGYYFAPHVTEAQRAVMNRQIRYCVEELPEPPG